MLGEGGQVSGGLRWTAGRKPYERTQYRLTYN